MIRARKNKVDTEMLRTRVARNLRALMKVNDNCKSQAKLAARSGLSQSTVNRILQAEQDTGIETIEVLAKALGVSMSDIIQEEDVPASQPLTGEQALEFISPFVHDWEEDDFVELIGALKAYRQLKKG